jgi:hypothetical protein
MEVGVVVWVKGKGSQAGWLEGTLVAKVLKEISTFSSHLFYRVRQILQFVLMPLEKISLFRESLFSLLF